MKLLTSLNGFVSRFGFPHEILSDFGSEFLSNLTKVFMDEYVISHITTSSYHPATNWSCERFNGTMKSTIRALVEENTDDWN